MHLLLASGFIELFLHEDALNDSDNKLMTT